MIEARLRLLRVRVLVVGLKVLRTFSLELREAVLDVGRSLEVLVTDYVRVAGVFLTRMVLC